MATNPFSNLFDGMFGNKSAQSGAFQGFADKFGPKKAPVSPFSIGSTPAAPVVPGFTRAPAPNMSVNVAPTATASKAPVAPKITAPAPVVNTPAQPVTTPASQVNAGASTTAPAPVAPATPSPEVLAAQGAVATAQKLYEDSQKIGPDELSTQEDVDKLVESTKTAYRNTSGQAIPLEFITGQLKSIEERAVGLAEPLERKLARLQAARTASSEASKFALERSDKALGSLKTDSATARTEAESARRFEVTQGNAKAEQDLLNKKFEEDKRQFGIEYAQKEREIGAKAAEKTAEATKTATQASSDSLSNLSLVNEIINAGPSKITGIGQNPLNFLGVTNQRSINQYNQLKGVLSLENRSKLKGSGAISDFEARTLEAASSALGRNLNNADQEKELKKVRGAFTTAAGLQADVKVKDPKTGKVDTGKLGRADIDSAIAQGFTVEYN